MKKFLTWGFLLSLGLITGLVVSSVIGRAHSSSQIIAKVKPSIVPIVIKEGDGLRLIGTGFVLSSKPYVVTNAHIAAYVKKEGKTKDLGISLPWPAKGNNIQIVIPCEIMVEDPKADVAVLMLDLNLPDLKLQEREIVRKYLKPVRTKLLKDVKVGQDVFMGGFPMSDRFGSFHSFHKGIIAKIDTLDSLDMRGTWAIQTDIVSFEGFSGAPLFLANTGEVIGIIWGGINVEQGKVLACATPIDYITGLLGLK